MGAYSPVKYKIIKDGKRVGFVIELGGELVQLSDSEIIERIKRGENLGLGVNKRGFKLLSGGAISDLPAIQASKSVKPAGIHCYTGDELDRYMLRFINSAWKTRDIVSQLVAIMRKPITGRLFTLSGLRGTGKTVALLQALRQYDRYKGLYVTLDTKFNGTSDELCDYLDKLIVGKEIVVIDEATRIKDLIINGDVLYERIHNKGHNLILSGTDSLALVKTQSSGLYHRVVDKNITFISLSESMRVMGFTFKDYIKIGGLYKVDSIDDFQKFTRYVDTAIVDNLLNTIEKNKTATGFGSIKEMSSVDLRSLVFGIIYSVCYKHILAYDGSEDIEKAYREYSFNKVINIFDLGIGDILSTDIMNDIICSSLGISRRYIATRNQITEVIRLMMELGIMIQLKNLGSDPDNFYFTNPSLVNQAYSKIYDVIIEQGVKTKPNYSVKSTYGLIYESVLVCHAYYYAAANGLKVAYYRDKSGREVDLIVYKVTDDWEDACSVYYEFKLTPKKDKAVKTTWLNRAYSAGEVRIPSDESKHLKKYIIYTGRNTIFKGFDKKDEIYSDKKSLTVDDIEKMNIGTELINATDFMLYPERYLRDLIA